MFGLGWPEIVIIKIIKSLCIFYNKIIEKFIK
jgi:hypothetical protein